MRCSTRSAIRLCSSAPSTAIPIARPSWRAVLLMPEARPPCAGGSTPRWAKVTSGLASPMPRADDDSPASRCCHDELRVEAHHQQRARPRTAPCRAASAPVSGTRSLSRPAASETAKATTASGASQRPTSTGVPRAHVEQEQRQVHERAERAGRQRRDDDRGAEERAVAEQLQVEHRVRPRAARRRRRRRGRRRPPRRARAPVALVQPSALPRSTAKTTRKRPVESVATPGQSTGLGSGSRDSRTWRTAKAMVGSPSTSPSTKIACHPNGSTSSAADERAGGEREADDRAPDPDRPPALGALELLGQQRQRAREDDRGAEPLQRPRGDQRARRRRQRAQRRGER